MAWLPEDFAHASHVDVDARHHVRPIRADDVDLDMLAVMSSRDRLFSIYGESWGWPPATMTAAQDREDLQYHEAEMISRSSFNYAYFDQEETALLGCVYIDPGDGVTEEGVPADAVVSWWVIDEVVGTDAELALKTFVPEWIRHDWPFAHVRFGVSAPVEPSTTRGE